MQVYTRCGMNLIAIYKCLCDVTRLRILHLLNRRALCVCHFQTILNAPQVAVSKHLAYLRKSGVVAGERRGQWVIYRLREPRSEELHRQLRCLQDCVQTDPVFRNDLKRLKEIQCECDWIPERAPAGRRTAK